MWFYKTKVGTFQIIPNQTAGRFDLWIANEMLAAYRSPLIAAKDVYRKETGYEDWDLLEDQDVPANLTQWQRGKW